MNILLIIFMSIFVSIAMVNISAKPRYIAAIIEIVISSMAIVGIQIVAMGFDFSKLTSWQFWVRTFALTACIFLLFRAVVNARFDKTEERDNVLEAKNNYSDLSKEKDLDFHIYLDNLELFH